MVVVFALWPVFWRRAVIGGLRLPNSFAPDEAADLIDSISVPRFNRYLLDKQGDRTAALRLYRWNAVISSAFMFPVHIAEVSLRNAIVVRLEAIYGPDWPKSEGFQRSLPNVRYGYSPKKDLQGCVRRHSNDGTYTSGRIVAELKLAFWESLLTRRHFGRLWQDQIRSVFRGLSSDQREERALLALLRSDLETMRSLRNRIAHHEPIFPRTLQDDLSAITRLIEARSLAVRAWVQMNETVSAELGMRP